MNWTNNNNTYTITTSINNNNNDDDGLLIAFSLQHSSTAVRKSNAIVYVNANKQYVKNNQWIIKFSNAASVLMPMTDFFMRVQKT